MRPNRISVRKLGSQRNWIPVLFSIGIGVLSCPKGFGSDDNFHMHMRYGLFGGAVTGVVQDKFNIPGALDAEVEYRRNNRQSDLMRAMMVVDPSTSQVRYLYAGYGRRFYPIGRSSNIEARDAMTQILIRPKYRTYFGVDAGLSETIARRLTESIVVQSAMVDIGINVGWIYQVDPGWGLEAHIGYARGYGIASVAVDNETYRFMLGVTYN